MPASRRRRGSPRGRRRQGYNRIHRSRWRWAWCRAPRQRAERPL
uniref:Uncharacterized protein n=1 Tax=Bionectria ochroleuca TaxID=29856 RepID=A0A0B7KDG5_BIOOC